MSMIGNFLAISQEQLDGLLAETESAVELLYPENGRRLPLGLVDIDKSWHGIHFLLTGTAWDETPPWSYVILGGTEIGPDIGYGPARYLLPHQVREVAEALTALPQKELANRYVPATLGKAEIYPDIIWERDGNEALEYLLSYYDKVVECYQDAAAKNQAMLLFLN